MSRTARSLPLLAVLLAGATVPLRPSPARADEGAGEEPPAAAPAETYEQTDRKKTMTIKLPRAWKSVGGEDVDPKALASFAGFYGEEGKSPNGFVAFYADGQFARALLARSITLPQMGSVRSDSLRQGPGWAEGCVTDEHRRAVWRRYVEKNNRVYVFQVLAADSAYDMVRPSVQKFLDTAAVPGEATPAGMGAGWNTKKSGDFDVLTDADPDRESSLKKAGAALAEGREILVKYLPGKPYDASRPAAWIFQNGQKFEDRVKQTLGIQPNFAIFNPLDRAAMVSILAESAQGHDDAVHRAGADQYVWQYFGGEAPIWVATGLATYGQILAGGGGKKVPPETLSRVKSAVAAGKRRLDQWFDVARWNEVTDNDQGTFELFAWHWYFKSGKGASKYKKQYAGYLQALRDSGDPALARKAFDGVNFDEMLQEFKAWANDWK